MINYIFYSIDSTQLKTIDGNKDSEEENHYNNVFLKSAMTYTHMILKVLSIQLLWLNWERGFLNWVA